MSAKPSKTMRLDPELLRQAKDAGIELPKAVEALLANLLKLNKCPYCGHIKKEKK